MSDVLVDIEDIIFGVISAAMRLPLAFEVPFDHSSLWQLMSPQMMALASKSGVKKAWKLRGRLMHHDGGCWRNVDVGDFQVEA